MKRKIDLTDILLIILMILPFLGVMALKVLFTPSGDEVEITGALIFFTIELPEFLPSFLRTIPITESQVNSLAVVLFILFLSLFLTRKLSVKNPSPRQHLAEFIVEKCEGLINANMTDPIFAGFGPFVGAVMGLSAFSSLLSLLGLYSPTGDINIVAGWAILVFFMITYYKLKCGPLYYLKGFTEPIFVMTPMNIISELATPLSMAFRHYGNIMSGSVIGVLIAYALGTVSVSLLGKIPVLGEIQLLRIGIPAVMSLYFDIFSGLLQAFIFAMLTMLNISSAFPAEDYYARKRK